MAPGSSYLNKVCSKYLDCTKAIQPTYPVGITLIVLGCLIAAVAGVVFYKLPPIFYKRDERFDRLLMATLRPPREPSPPLFFLRDHDMFMMNKIYPRSPSSSFYDP